MTDAFAWVIHTYGQKMTYYDENGEAKGEGMAIVQPMTEADWQYTAGALGAYRTDRFLCLAVPELPLGSLGLGGHVEWGGNRYEIMTVRPVWVAGKTTHYWMALRCAEETGV